MATGRGRPSSLDLLPDWADEARLWALGELRERKRTAQDILEEFNEKLRQAALLEGITDPPQISRSAFSRHSMVLAATGRRLQEAREIARVLAPKLEDSGDDKLTLLVAETIKTLAHEMLSSAGDLSADGETAEMLMMTSRALKHAEEAKRISGDTRVKIEREMKDKMAKAFDASLAKVPDAEKGLSAERAAQIRRDVLGVR